MKRLLVTLGLLAYSAAFAQPLQPQSDDEVIERLPPLAARQATPAPQELPERARELVQHARRTGDPRFAGQALALLKPWRSDDRAAAPIVIALAEAEQHLHDFDAARQRLEALVSRDPAQAQAWLMLATLHRVQGRYADSDTACRALDAAGARLLAGACRAENDALRGRHAPARDRLTALIPATREPALRAWLLTTLSELEERAGRADAAGAAYRAALRTQPGGYAAIAYADFLLAQGRPRDARVVLHGQPDSDAVLLRIAIADPAGDAGRAAADELRRRFAQADLRPGAGAGHARERALFALHVARDAEAALRHARENVKTQREPLDLCLLLRSAQAAGDAAALAWARQLIQETGLEDRRIEALL